MAARKNTRNTNARKPLPWGVILVSFALGAFVMFLMNLKQVEPQQTEQKQTKKASAKKQIEPIFDFYSVLPEDETSTEIVPKLKTKAEKKQPHQQKTKPNKAEQQAEYMLQVGSFRKAHDADSYKARLALLGVESSVQRVTIDDKDTWHRVQVGPIKGRQQADKVQQQLKKDDIKSLLMRVKRSQ